MATYSGFFDAAFDEATGTYDRAYDAAEFTGYFAAFVGSGVCVHGNDDSMKVNLDTTGKKALVNPGYLFLRGYWLKNTALYPVDLSGLSTGTYAIYAKLNLGKRVIELGYMEKADPERYPDSLVLAYVTKADNGTCTIADTRSNTKICGLIDAAGSLSVKVEYALNYINTQIEDKLNQIEHNLKEQEKVIDGKIEEANSLIAKIAPPAIGTIKLSASQSVGQEWLPCDGRFVSESDYPELVAALGKLTPSGDKFKLLSEGEIGAQISNSVCYQGKLWVYSYTKKTLYGVDLESGSLTTIPVSSASPAFKTFLSPTPLKQLTLSIVPHTEKAGARLFLAQIIQDGTVSPSSGSSVTGLENNFLLFAAEFTGSESSLTLTEAIKDISGRSIVFSSDTSIPYVVSESKAGEEVYRCYCGAALSWKDGETTAETLYVNLLTGQYGKYQRFGFSSKNKGEAVSVYGSNDGYEIRSETNHLFAYKASGYLSWQNNRTSYLPLDVAGTTAVLVDIQISTLTALELQRAKTNRIDFNIQIPRAARIFPDAGAYLFGKDIYMIFVGTGIIFFREFTANSVGYLDTTGVLGTITQYGYLDYSQDENTLYLVGQDTNNKVKVAKMVLNTLFDYANDGAWLPTVAADGVPAYIKAKEPK